MLFIFWLLPVFLFGFAPLLPKDARAITGAVSTFQTHHFFDKEWRVRESYNDFIRNQLEVLLEYGLSHQNNLSVWCAFDVVQDHLNGNSYDFTDAEVRFKQALIEREDRILTAEAVALIPIYRKYEPEIRYGRYGAEVALLYAETFFPYDYKTTLDSRIGYRWYSGFPADQVRASLATWVDLNCHWQILAQTELEWGLNNGKEPFNRSFFFYNANYRVWKGRLEMIFYFNRKLAFSFGYMQHLVGQNIAVGGEGYARLSYCF